MIDKDKALQVAQRACLIGREILLDYFGHLTDVSEKNQAGLVSEADVASEKAISAYILSEFPNTYILGEEDQYKNPGQSLDLSARQKGVWMIDPLDGTTNYVHRFPIYCVSIGFEYQGELFAGAIDVPTLAKTYSAAKGKGAYVNGQKLNVSRTSEMKDSLLATGFSSYDKKSLQEQLSIFSSIVSEVRGVRRAGSAAFDLCMVAEGIFEGYWEKNLSAWDTAAGALLVKEAGGEVSSYQNEKFDPFMSTIIAANPFIHRTLQERISRLLKQ